LLNDGSTVLRTQADSSQEWRSFSENAKLFATQLSTSDGDLRKLISVTPGAATELSGLLRENTPGLPVLVANLLTTSRVFATRIDGLEELLVNTPKAVAATSAAITPDGGHLSLALTFNSPPPCRQGYESTTVRSSTDLSPLPFNTAASCTLPPGDISSVRGSQNAPTGGVPAAVVPGGLAGPLGVPELQQVSTSLEELLWLGK
jgi:phospholipid/cholesterol/gamma-HCH transport system substrate-binding protein